MSFPVLENKIKVLPHSCFICSKAFVRKNTLLKHYREHPKELGADLEHLEERRAQHLQRKGGPEAGPTHILPDAQDQNTIQNLDSNDIIITTLYSSGMTAAETIDIVQCLDPAHIAQNLAPEEGFPLTCEAHECVECKASFSSEEALRRHSLIHERDQTFSCDTCCAVFPSKNELRTHGAIHRLSHACADCEEGFETRGELERHRLSHKVNPGSYLCGICFNDFASKKSLKVHSRVHRLEQTPDARHVCEFCGETFPEEGGLRRHYLSHPEESSADADPHEEHVQGHEAGFRCPTCGKGLATERELGLHRLDHGFDKKTNSSCEVCEMKFRSKSDFDRHRETHVRQKIFVCTVCDDAFRDKSEYERHKRRHPEGGKGKRSGVANGKRTSKSKKRRRGEDVVCEICDEGVASDEYEDHLFAHGEGKTHTCRICSESFVFKEDLAQHTRTAHEEERPFSCGDCPESFRFKSDLREHRQKKGRRATREREAPEPEEYEILKPKKRPRKKEAEDASPGRPTERRRRRESESCSRAELREDEGACRPKKWPHLCKNCERRFATKEELLAHKKVHSRRQPFICRVCNEGFREREALEEHGRIHDTAPHFPCNLCGDPLPSREALREHKREAHSGEIAYICSACGATFEEKTEFRAHRATHGAIPHQCKVCGETFGTRKELKRHYLKHILERPNLCRICNAPFVQWGALRSHYLGHTRN